MPKSCNRVGSKIKTICMKQTALLFLLIFCCYISRAQLTTPLSLISTSGGIGAVNSTTIEWTLGETFIGSGTNGNQTTTIGEQQDSLNIFPLGIPEAPFSKVKVYPNPANTYIKADNLPDGEKTILLTDMAGRCLQSFKTTGQSVTVYTSQLASGIYNLELVGQENSQSSFKISIINK